MTKATGYFFRKFT